MMRVAVVMFETEEAYEEFSAYMGIKQMCEDFFPEFSPDDRVCAAVVAAVETGNISVVVASKLPSEKEGG